jgi:RimJ/RimL family protein N-acetyltransferase
MCQVYEENKSHWPFGLSADHFDGGCYLIREKQSSVPVGFTGFQIRIEKNAGKKERVGYYSIGILPAYRKCGYAKQAVAKLLEMKSASVDRMKAMIVAGNTPSIALAESLGVPAVIKSAAYLRPY